MNNWSEQFNEEYPKCKMCGQCCRCASPSVASVELEERSKNKEDAFARDFFSIFIPYKSLEEAGKINPEVVERSLKVASHPNSKVKPEDVVFYHCKYISEDNKCKIHQDRPQLCRDYPDNPFLVFAQGCSYEKWSKNCKKKYYLLKEELDKLKEYKQELEMLKYQQKVSNLLKSLNNITDDDYKFILLCPSLSVVSPGRSWIRL